LPVPLREARSPVLPKFHGSVLMANF
jgi:hypothetical protein